MTNHQVGQQISWTAQRCPAKPFAPTPHAVQLAGIITAIDHEDGDGPVNYRVRVEGGKYHGHEVNLAPHRATA